MGDTAMYSYVALLIFYPITFLPAMLRYALLAITLLLAGKTDAATSGQQSNQGKTEKHKFAAKEEVHDTEHLKQHLKDKIDVEKLTEEQERVGVH
ncbi:unnamed protein product [Strongylus vulgaris]|uniref:Uncharacterized protein n=1 Tax=Strongylus vulgaris TaxID=40348 RepID=A0A3P7ITW2_STRVU|nr:unnamed protein product [Strongylus vulgaris]